MSKHTPGPWFTAGEELSGAFMDRFMEMETIELTNGQTLIAEVQKLNDELSGEEVEANARLIAAAPDLLEALEDILSELDGEADGPVFDIARAAIAKARGKK